MQPWHCVCVCVCVCVCLVDEELVEILDGAAFDCKLSPLHYACLLGHVDMVELLLQAGASASSEYRDGHRILSPASLAALGIDPAASGAITTALVTHASPLKVSFTGRGALSVLHTLARHPELLDALGTALQHQAGEVEHAINNMALVHLQICKLAPTFTNLLWRAHSGVRPLVQYQTPLGIASSTEAVKALVGAGARVTVTTDDFDAVRRMVSNVPVRIHAAHLQRRYEPHSACGCCRHWPISLLISEPSPRTAWCSHWKRLC